jgi:hypothetical protein
MGSSAYGFGSTATNGGSAFGYLSTATENNTVSFGSASIKRRLTNLADGIASTDAATYGQLQTATASMQSITDSMSVSLNDFNSRLGTLETTVSGLPTSGTGAGTGVDSSVVSKGDSDTLASANSNAAAGDASTLASANTHADQGDAATLASANDNAAKGDAKTLGDAKAFSTAGDVATLEQSKAYANTGDAMTYSRAQEFARAGDAKTLQEAQSYSDRGDARLERKMGDMKDRLEAGIASVAAQPTISGLGIGQKGVAVGTGSYSGKNAIGIAAGFRPTENLTFTAGISGSDGSSAFVFRTGAQYTWQ